MAQITADMLASILHHADRGERYPLTFNELRQLAHMAKEAERYRKALEKAREVAKVCIQFERENLEAITDEAEANSNNNFTCRQHWRTRLALSESWLRSLSET